MATSGSYSFSMQRNAMIESAYRKTGAVGSGQVPTADQYNEASLALNSMIKSWRGLGINIQTLDWIVVPLRASDYVTGTDGHVYECIRNHTSDVDTQPVSGSKYLSFWRLAIDSVTPVAWATGTDYVSICNYELDPNITSIYKAFVRMTPSATVTGSASPFDRHIQLITQGEYFDLGNKTNPGQAILCYFKRTAKPEIFMYPFPQYSDIGTINFNFSVMRFPQDMNSPDDNTDFLQEWEEAIIYNLAVRLCHETGADDSTFKKLSMQAQTSLGLARRMDQQRADIQFQVNFRGF